MDLVTWGVKFWNCCYFVGFISFFEHVLGGLTFLEILEWKQCAPSGLVSQRFGSIKAACEAFEHNTVQWSFDRCLRRMGDQMALNRAVSDYKPTAIKLAEASGGGSRSAPWAGCLQESL